MNTPARLPRAVRALALAVLCVIAAGVTWWRVDHARHAGLVWTRYGDADSTHVVSVERVLELEVVDADRSVRGARFVGFLEVSDSNEYEFFVSTDSQLRLLVDDVPLVDLWDEFARGESRGWKRLSRGLHKLRIELRNPAGGASLRVEWGSTLLGRHSLSELVH